MYVCINVCMCVCVCMYVCMYVFQALAVAFFHLCELSFGIDERKPSSTILSECMCYILYFLVLAIHQ